MCACENLYNNNYTIIIIIRVCLMSFTRILNDDDLFFDSLSPEEKIPFLVSNSLACCSCNVRDTIVIFSIKKFAMTNRKRSREYKFWNNILIIEYN